ncbi:Receptor-like protein kinase FERONIA [Morella rubra]|uniref:Receptor-like protein kinase FERONIA n=1 Tax=Morella rubra TaxID=262757 RepID=A0A6A1UT02_9ROSI|nr:Receptor-like protein kinase FERONIA [Morella rubra]
MRSTLLQRFTSLYLAFLLHHLTSTVAGDSQSRYTPVDNILLNCGSSGDSTALDGRTWTGDVNPKFYPLEQAQVPFATARLSLSPFTYLFPVTAGQKFIRLYFYPASYSNFDRSKGLFSVKADRFTLLRNFNASLTADADGDSAVTIYREYCVNVEEEDQRLNITFTPSPSVSNSYAFINGIEILSMPTDLYYTPADRQEASFVGQERPYLNQNSTALEMAYRLTVGERFISRREDTGMFREWSQEEKYLKEYRPPLSLNFNGTIALSFKNIRNQTAEKKADVIKWGGGTGTGVRVPVYKDYVIPMFAKESVKKVNLYIAVGAEQQNGITSYRDAILNGVEIFKLRDAYANLAGPNPDPLPSAPPPPTVSSPRQSPKSKTNGTTIAAAAAGGAAGFVIMTIFGFLILRRSKRIKESVYGDGTTWWGPFYFSKTKSTKTHSHQQLRQASIIGVGGFGNVYKGQINGGANPVAIKRLAPGSQQGADEFETEIEMLSQLRHQNLVSLIGYCNDGNEMILVYEYVARGTLRDHLYKTENPPLLWKQRLPICIGAARGLNYLHAGAKHSVIHRDVKTTN